MADEHKKEPNLDSEVEVKSSSPSSLKSKVYHLFGRERPVHKVLGGGKPADIFMWKNKNMPSVVLGGATVAWVLFQLVEYDLLTLLCHVVIVALVVLFLWYNVTMFIHKYVSPKIPQVHIPEESLLQLAIFRLWILSILSGCRSFLNFLVLLFTVPLIYDKYADKVDSYGEKFMAELKKQSAVLDAKVLSKIPRGPLKDKKKD
ncbi:hypothetical protein N665_0143s0015 [Sinapis alba]|nr:hypothetical protein N665_0143s0015 [Sinapis alba]